MSLRAMLVRKVSRPFHFFLLRIVLAQTDPDGIQR